MRRLRAVTRIIVYSSILYFALATPAYAYIDPGSGSYVLQLLVASLLAGLFAVEVFWSKVRDFGGLGWRE